MLVLTQLSVGGFLVDFAAALTGFASGPDFYLLRSICLGLGYLGLAASLFHLGRPHLAYRAFLGWRHSWLSREVIAFALFIAFATVLVASDRLAPALVARGAGPLMTLRLAVVVSGLCGVVSSVMVYHVVRRPFWHASIAGVKFVGTAAVLGLAATLASLSIVMAGPFGAGDSIAFLFPLIAGGLTLLSAAKLSFEARDWRVRRPSGSASLARAALLLRGDLRGPARVRMGLGLVGGVLLPYMAIVAFGFALWLFAAGLGVLSLVISMAAEMLERSLFFRACARPKMAEGAS
jgi:DMSO reductase anchor subunit